MDMVTLIETQGFRRVELELNSSLMVNSLFFIINVRLPKLDLPRFNGR